MMDVGLKAGQYLWLHDMRAVADGSAVGAVQLAQRAGAVGIVAKYDDGHAVMYRDGETWAQQVRELAPICAHAGLHLVPWGYVYPSDGDAAFGHVVQQALHDSAPANASRVYVLDAEIEFDRDPQAAAAAQQILAAVQQAAPEARIMYTSWGWPDQHPRFPWHAFQEGSVAFLPQIYPGTLRAGVDAGTYWNRAYGGPKYGGPNPGRGPAGWSALQPQRAIVPTFDLGRMVPSLAQLAHRGGMPTITWWVMDDMTADVADQLAQTPYAQHASSASPRSPAAPSPTVDISQALAALAQAAASIRAAQQALQQGH